MKLTKAQKEALRILWRHELPECSYKLRLSMNTLKALERRELVKATDRDHAGSFYSPTTVVKWRITPAGRKALEESK